MRTGATARALARQLDTSTHKTTRREVERTGEDGRQATGHSSSLIHVVRSEANDCASSGQVIQCVLRCVQRETKSACVQGCGGAAVQRRDSVYSERGVSVAPVRVWGEASVDESMQYGGKRVLLFVVLLLRSKMSAVGFEPTSPKTLRPERNPLDHSGKLTRRYLHLFDHFQHLPSNPHKQRPQQQHSHKNRQTTHTPHHGPHLVGPASARADAQTHTGIWHLATPVHMLVRKLLRATRDHCSLRAVSARCSVIR